MADKFILMDLDDDRSKHLAGVLQNKTCKKILDFLADEKEASENDIAQALSVPINTVEYNLKKLISAGLVEKVKNFFWSVKGKKIKMYKLAKKHIIISPKKSKPSANLLRGILPVAAVILILLGAVLFLPSDQTIVYEEGFHRFGSDQELLDAFEKVKSDNRYFGRDGAVMETISSIGSPSAAGSSKSADYSDTNIQVAGVDEADIIKTDGEFIYAVAEGKLIIMKAYPSDEAEILSTINLDKFDARGLFIEEDRLMVFGGMGYNSLFDGGEVGSLYRHYPAIYAFSVRLYDISDRENPELLRAVDFEGNYISSRKIGADTYFVINSYPDYSGGNSDCLELVPQYREGEELLADEEEFEPIAACTDIGYVAPLKANNFITIASISMTDEDADVEKEVVVGSGQNIYASLENMYIAQTKWGGYSSFAGPEEDYEEKTIITKFNLDDGEIEFDGIGEVRGHILNQFSMDEHEGNFRIATTSRDSEIGDSRNNVYVLDEDLEVVGELEDMAPGEKIYSVRFMGGRGYVVTFKKVDPLFVIDLSSPENPEILGKLKIPGYSDYLHPYDENHIIGIGKDTVEADEDLKDSRNLDFAWYQGVKMAIFDVSDVENPVEMHKVVIGDRGTDSPALHDHKAFLFDREKDLLVLPITLAEIKGEKSKDNQYGEFVFQGAYVYDLTLEGGFDLSGKISHYDDESVYEKSGYYFRGNSDIKRSLYIDDVLYTFSNTRLQMNGLDDLDRIGFLEW
ncbi:helix-turn-helix domain-containing protein [archaeon]|jgi:inhibitor of cysteine peptidase|nr:helix-turn-helix domain-containing protein [archaeon]MBT3578058.1 helix-turn-helix domain-containing protein [archaeon]MBT6819969.1 helix-turn-helix domain-containing protein [archaeon]MBT7025006.1 helix-turn-helix domain-containing protein [archaeon]MBT7238625.1 helix-turn-helix domain-containing protein [archaeon]